MIKLPTRGARFPVARLFIAGVILALTASSNLQAAEGRGVMEYLSYTFEVGGTTMYLLLLLSIIGLGFAIERLVRLKKANFVAPGLLPEVIELHAAGNDAAVAERCAASQSGIARGIEAILPYLHESVDEVRTIATDVLTAEVRAHQRRVQPLAAIATLAPLLGLSVRLLG